jgi:hypothetical protein
MYRTLHEPFTLFASSGDIYFTVLWFQLIWSWPSALCGLWLDVCCSWRHSENTNFKIWLDFFAPSSFSTLFDYLFIRKSKAVIRNLPRKIKLRFWTVLFWNAGQLECRAIFFLPRMSLFCPETANASRFGNSHCYATLTVLSCLRHNRFLKFLKNVIYHTLFRDISHINPWYLTENSMIFHAKKCDISHFKNRDISQCPARCPEFKVWYHQVWYPRI